VLAICSKCGAEYFVAEAPKEQIEKWLRCSLYCGAHLVIKEKDNGNKETGNLGM
jgi:DNA-directed RNA polymerase subunit RPC12/RpoP